MTFDIVIVGAGIAGASLAAMIGERARVALVEAEAMPGYHTTGRSAAFWSETYGGPSIQPLTTASGPWLSDPPAEYGGQSYLSPRGKLEIASAGEEHLIDRQLEAFAGSGVALEKVDAAGIAAHMPELRDHWRHATWLESCQDIDVARLHQDCLAVARRSGAELYSDARIVSIARDKDRWRIDTARGRTISADILVNAAGAWADEIARLAGIRPIGIEPKRRTMVQTGLAEPPGRTVPVVMAANGSFYFKGEGAQSLWVSPHDEIPSPPCDAQPEEIDIATAVDRLEKASHFSVRKVERSWAGLRSFAPDRLPVIGPDAREASFFWFAGQGGFGIQTSPVAAMIGAALLLGKVIPTAAAGIDHGRFLADRFA